MPEREEANTMSTSQTEREQVQEAEAEQREETAPPVRERWGQDPWEMRWGC
jgi:hypothetical protein